MPETVFINYTNGIHQNNNEQLRRILSHTSKQKQSGKKAILTRKNQTRADELKLPRRCQDEPPSQPERPESYPSLRNDGALNAIEFDPFNAMPSLETPGSQEVLQYLLQYYGFRIQPLQMALGCAQEMIRHSFSAAIASPEFLYALMASACADYEASKNMAISQQPSSGVLWFRGQSLKALSTKLRGGSPAIDVGSIMAITMLMAMDIAYQDPQPVLLHRRALRKMLQLPPQPGRERLGWWVQSHKLAVYTSGYLSEEIPSWCLAPGESILDPYPISRRPPLHYPTPNSPEALELLESVPEGFRSATLQGHLSCELLEIIARMWTVLKILDKAHRNTVEPNEVDFVNSYKPEHEFHTCIDCLRRISPAQPASCPFTTPSASIEHVVCLGLVAFINCVFGCMTYGSLFKAVQDSLSQVIANCNPDPGMEDCVIWAQLVSIWAVSITTGPRSETIEGAMMKIKRQYGSELRWEALSNILESMLWADDMATVCSLAWNRILQHVSPVAAED